MNAEMKDINRKNLWRLESINDLEGAEIQMCHPVKEDGSPDPSRKPRFCGLLDVTYQGSSAKMRFDIIADTLEEALTRLKPAGEAFGIAKLEELDNERKELFRTSGRTIVP